MPSVPLYSFSLVMLLSMCCMWGCTDTSLYHREEPPLAADRVAIEGRVCTEDPEHNKFPARLIIMVDQAQGPLYSDYDPGQQRLQMLNGLIQTALAKPEYSLAVFGYSGRVTRLAPEEGIFTRNPGLLLNAVSRLSLPEGCIGDELCRDYQGGLQSIKTLIEDDLASMEAGQRSVTQYTVLWLAAGPQVPLALNRDCCARGDRTCARAEGAERPSASCQAQLDIDIVQRLRGETLEAGAGGFQLHVMHLATEEQQINVQMTQLFEQLTFAGGGRYARFGAANSSLFKVASLACVFNDFATEPLINGVPKSPLLPILDTSLLYFKLALVVSLKASFASLESFLDLGFLPTPPVIPTLSNLSANGSSFIIFFDKSLSLIRTLL